MSDCDEGDVPLKGRVCPCGLRAPHEDDAAGWLFANGACPDCKRVWPEKLIVRYPHDGGPAIRPFVCVRSEDAAAPPIFYRCGACGGMRATTSGDLCATCTADPRISYAEPRPRSLKVGDPVWVVLPPSVYAAVLVGTPGDGVDNAFVVEYVDLGSGGRGGCRVVQERELRHRGSETEWRDGVTGASSASSAVEHPPHYGGADNPYETIRVIEAWELDFSLGNAVKYISRAGKKDPTKLVEDLKKAAWYLERAIQNAERAK